MGLQNPYPGSEILTKDIGQILEEFLQDQWTLSDTGLTENDIAWGGSGLVLEKRRKNITIRAYQIFMDIRDMALGGAKNDYFELWRIDVFVRDTKTTTERSPKLFKILKHIENIFLSNKTGLQSKGISSVNLYNIQPVENPDSDDVYHGVCSIEIRYVMDLV